MKFLRRSIVFGFLLLALNIYTHGQQTQDIITINQKIRKATLSLTSFETKDDVDAFMNLYKSTAISMPEYQVTSSGVDDIKDYYTQIFQRQLIKSYIRTPQEFIHLDKTVIEIGTLEKCFTKIDSGDSLLKQNGKYWNIWEVSGNRAVMLKGEIFGFVHPIDNPSPLTVKTTNRQPDEAEVYAKKQIPFELRAYNALMEKAVKTRDANLRLQFFTEDAVFMPFAQEAVSGYIQLKPYLTEYSNRGTVTIDSISCYSYDFEYVGDYVIEYNMFKVSWSMPANSGKMEGKGIRLWKRQPDHSLMLYREISTHNLIN